MWSLIKDALAILGTLASLVGAIQVFRLWLWGRKITWDDALRTAEKVLEQIEHSQWEPTLVIGLGRSGGIWGGWLAGNLGSKPFALVDDKYEKGMPVDFPGGEEMMKTIRKVYGDNMRVLIVEGACSRGETPLEFLGRFSEQLSGWDIKMAVLYRSSICSAPIDFVGMDGPEPWPKKFPWHYRAKYRPYLRDLFRG